MHDLKLPRPSDASVLRGDAWESLKPALNFPVNARQSFTGYWASAAGMYLLLKKGKTITQLLHTHQLKRKGCDVNHNDVLLDWTRRTQMVISVAPVFHQSNE
jgi:hypothetical protein